VSEAFSQFLSAGTATAAQIEFVNMVIEHLTDQSALTTFDHGIIEASLRSGPIVLIEYADKAI
jgi:hypothetical protein